MKTCNRLLLGTLMAVGLASCASDDPAAVEPIKTFPTDQAVINIRIMATDENATKAETPASSNPSFSNGSPNENVVDRLNFYFYDRTGEFVTSKEGVRYSESGMDPGTQLVEEVGTSRIVLTDLLGQNYPSYVVAVLNYRPATSTSPDPFKQNLSKVHTDAIRERDSWSVGSNGEISNFVMTSATHSNNDPDFWYFATPISEKNFSLQKEGDKPGDEWPTTRPNPDGEGTVANEAVPVEIYVERLAAKVELLFPGFTQTDDKCYLQQLPDEYEVDGKKQKLTVKLYGWGVNGTAKRTKYFKGVNDNPNAFTTADGWNYNGTNRSYWAKTPGYGANEYSTSFSDVTKKTEDKLAEDEPLKYISWNDVKANPFTKNISYINPHTEDGARINLIGNDIFHGAITEVLIAGQIVDASGKGVTLFQLGESYYTKEGVISYLLNASNTHIWKKTDENKFKQIEAEDVDVAYGYDGTFKIVMTDAGKANEWYRDETGTEKWNASTDVEAEVNAFVPEQLSFCYNDGMLYYNIPIRHLRDYVKGEQIKTGMFGVVRNHHYKVSVTAIKSLGHSVYRADEHIIPPSNETRYMIGSSIRILSWRIVNQTAEL